MSHTQVVIWHKRFLEGREDIENYECSDRPVISTTDENGKKKIFIVCHHID